MNKIRIRTFTLLEVLIALALTTLLLGVLLAAYFQAETASREGERQRLALWPKKLLERRLEPLFFDLVPLKEKDSYFISDGSSLIFTYYNGVVMDASFSGEVTSRLSIDPEGRFSLLTLPRRSKWAEGQPPPFRFEALYPDVKEAKFAFFGKEGWKTSWDDKKELPGIVRITLTTASNEQTVLELLIPEVIGVLQR